MLTYQEKREYLMTVLFRAKSLNKSEKIVALALAFKVDYTGVTRMTQAEIGAMTSLTPRRVRFILESLSEKIKLQIRSDKGTHGYYFPQWVQL